MAIKYYENFTGAVGVPSEFTQRTNGNGAISITSGHLRLTSGGTSSGDTAALAFSTALDTSKMYVISGELKMTGTAGALVPSIISLVNSSGVPSLQTGTNRNAALRIWQEYQMSSGVDSQDRIQAKFKNSSGTQYNWVASTSTWTSTFTHTRDFFDEGSYYRLVIVYDGTVSPATTRTLVFGYTEGYGWEVNYDSSEVDFGTAAAEVDPVDDDLWVVLGELTNDAAPDTQWTFDFRRVMVGEIVPTNLKEFMWTNKGNTAFPIDYDIYTYVNPMPDDQSMWISRFYDGWYVNGDQASTVTISRGTDHWVKDPHVFYDGTNYWMVCQFRDSTTTDSEIFVYDTTDLLNGTWGTQTLISSPDTGEVKHEFPWLTKYGSTWYLFYGVEFDTLAWEIQYKTSTAANPRSGWSSATTILEKGADTNFDDRGVTQPFLIWYDGTFTGGTWYMLYAGENGSNVWEGGVAKSTTGITGNYTRIDTDPVFPIETYGTLLSGGHTDTAVLTVDSTTGAAVGMHLYLDSQLTPLEVLSVDSGTQLTVNIEVTDGDNENLDSFSSDSFAPRLARRINGYWVVYGTSFKGPLGKECTAIYVDTTGNADFDNCTFRQLRVGDSGIDLAIPIVPQFEISNENAGMAWEELTPIIPSDRMPLVQSRPKMNVQVPVQHMQL